MTFTSRRIRDETPSRWQIAAKKAAPVFIRLGTFAVLLYGKWKVRHDAEERQTARIQILKKTSVILIGVLAGVLILAGTVKALVSLRILNIQSIFAVAGTPLIADENGFTNVLLLGAGDKDHDGVDLTDAVMIASIDPKGTHSVVLLSLPRDLYVLHSELMGRGRVNELYRNYKNKLRRDGMPAQDASKASIRQMGKEIGTLLGMPIHYAVKVDFTAFVEVVDELGGVDIEVPEDLVDPEYPGPNYTYETFSILKGPQHLDGETALKYARSRHTTSDFDRAARQQQILTALGQKARDEGIASSPGKITALLSILSEHMETTMTAREIIGGAALGDRIDRQNVIAVQLNIANGVDTPFYQPGGFLYAPPRDQFDGASVLLPVSIPQFPVTWKQIQTLSDVLFTHRGVYVAKPRLTLLNGTKTSGLAGKLDAELTRYVFDVEKTDNVSDERPRVTLPMSVIVARTPEDKPMAEFFGNLLKIPVGPLPAQVAVEKQGQITIILGEDYAYKPLQDLVP